MKYLLIAWRLPWMVVGWMALRLCACIVCTCLFMCGHLKYVPVAWDALTEL